MTVMQKTTRYKEPSQQEFVRDYLLGLQKSVALMRKGKKSTRTILEPLIDSFRVYNLNRSFFSDQWYLDFLTAASLPDDQGIEIQRKLIAEVESLAADAIDIRVFIQHYALALRVGLLNLGLALRNKAREAALHGRETYAQTHFHRFCHSIGALYELRRFEEAEQLINTSTVTTPVYLNKEKHLRALLTPGAVRPDQLIPVESEVDLAFADFIKGKSIAVVGPTKSESADAQEIDSFDVVVRCNYREKGIGTDSVFKGLRCDVAYYNIVQLEHILLSNLENWPTDLPWLVHKHSYDATGLQQKLSQLSGYHFHTRKMPNLSQALFNGKFNAIPNLLLDLLRFQPSRIKVFHADLMLSVNRTEGYRAPSEEELSDKYNFHLDDFTNIDPITQFYTLRTLFDDGKIEGDPRFSKVMQMDEASFMDQLQTNYGNYGRIQSGL